MALFNKDVIGFLLEKNKISSVLVVKRYRFEKSPRKISFIRNGHEITCTKLNKVHVHLCLVYYTKDKCTCTFKMLNWQGNLGKLKSEVAAT